MAEKRLKSNAHYSAKCAADPKWHAERKRKTRDRRRAQVAAGWKDKDYRQRRKIEELRDRAAKNDHVNWRPLIVPDYLKSS